MISPIRVISGLFFSWRFRRLESHYLFFVLGQPELASHVASIYNQRSESEHSSIVDSRMIGHDDRAVTSAQRFVGERDPGKRASAVERHLGNERIVIADLGAFVHQLIDYAKRG